MHITTIVIAAAFAVSASSWKIPTGATNGIYSAHLDAAGVEVHTKLREIPTPSVKKSLTRGLSRRYEGQIFCGCGYNMDPGNCNAAVDSMKDGLRNEDGVFSYIPGHMAFYAIRNNVVAFACNRGDGSYPLGANSFGADLAEITRYCGLYIAGSYQRAPDYAALITGYMRYSDGDDFCAASTGSGAGNC
ncbi:unnamed protein product [Periconia digitata]|uniref:Uncharacterized protein n=1 Tax=Periconia digitata TaxID=1303443 RepID=A0A9W4U9J3_9PLEO|nr:unnamed protein product [Periconia digitata]